MKRKLWFGLILVLVLIALLVGGRTLQSRRAAQAEAASAPKAAVVLDLAAADIVSAQRLELPRAIAISGSVRAVNSAFVKARVAAEITKVHVREGQAVKAGQLLVQQDSTEFDWRVRQADQQAMSARAQVEIAQRSLANNKALVAQGFISPTALDNSVSNDAAAQANLQVALAALEIAKKSRADAALVAPIAGLIAQRLAQPGERVAIDTRLLEIVDLSQLEIEAALAPDDVAALRIGSLASLQIDGINAAIGAKVVRINPTAQAGSRSVLVYLALDAHPALRQGLFARGRIVTSNQRVLAVPATAARADRALPYVLVLDGGKVKAQTVNTGLRGTLDGVEFVEVTQGLAEGAKVLAGSAGSVTEGAAWRLVAAAVIPAPAPAPAASAASR